MTEPSVSIGDNEFLEKVDNNQIAFAKGDILICDVRVTQNKLNPDCELNTWWKK